MWLKNSICKEDPVVSIYSNFYMSQPYEFIMHTHVMKSLLPLIEAWCPEQGNSSYSFILYLIIYLGRFVSFQSATVNMDTRSLGSDQMVTHLQINTKL